MVRHRLVGRLIWIVPAGLFLLHSLLFRSWLIDDAGISFAYARNLALGYGLVSQPGRMPVEGYSNFLWTVSLSPFFALDLFSPPLTPKVWSACLVFLSFLALYRLLHSLDRRGPEMAAAVLTFLAVNTPFVVWATSGLENPLYVLLLSLLLLCTLRATVLEETTVRAGLLGGLLAGGLGLTRPDGVVFFPAFPVLLLVRAMRRKAPPSRLWPALGGYLGLFAAIYGGFLVFRWTYYHDLVPNTYYAKGGPTLQDLLNLLLLRPEALSKILDGLYAVAGPFGGLVLLALVATTVVLLTRRRFRREHLVLAVFLLLALADYVLMPSDWHGEFRYATSLVVLVYLYAVTIAVALLRGLERPRRVKVRLAGLILAVCWGLSLLQFGGRSLRFAQDPSVPFAEVARLAERFDRYADVLGLENASVLLPDVGGTLYYSRLQVYDLGGLTDRTVALTLLRRQDLEAFHDYVFDTVRPTFIHTHGLWAYLARLDDDPRFRRDYAAIREGLDPWIREKFGLEMYSGDYVRREVAGGRLGELQNTGP
ncbi:MAG: hypothetical protein ACP5OO_12660 [Chloroflexia bacterium]